jgi:DNA segregation ATPase FtsK/SpoIIIE-like protein
VTKQIQTLETEIAKLQAELERYDLNSPIKRQQYLELGLPDFKRIGEQIGIERGELSQSRATHQRWEELTAMFGVDRSAEQYEAMKREREEFNETIFGESEAAPERRLSDDERLIEQSIQIIRRENVASTSVLQRRLRVGYESAIQILDELERRGIVGPSKGAEPRDIISN